MTANTSRGSLQLLIVGAGIGGLSAAIRLVQLGHDVTVLEQAPELGEVGAGLQLAPNATRVLDRLGLLDEVGRTAVQAEWSVRRRWEDGRVLGRFPLGEHVTAEFGAPYWHAHRRDLHDCLVAAARRCESTGRFRLHLDAQVEKVDTDGVRPEVITVAGDRYDADAVIGADGIHSAVRREVFGTDETTPSGDMAYRVLIDASEAWRRPGACELVNDPTVTIWLGPERHLVHYYIRRRELVNFVGVVPATSGVEESWSAEGDKDSLLATLEGWDERVRDLVDAAFQVSCWALNDRAPMPQWTRGHVTLLGDACHPMLPYQAQGAAQALEDAWVLGQALADADTGSLGAALAAYEQRRRPRATAVQQASRRNRELFHMPDGAEQQARDAALAEQRGDFESYAWLWDPDELRDGEPRDG